MKIIFTIILFSIFFYCCTSTHMIGPSAYKGLNEKIREERVEITLIYDKVIVGENLHIEAESASWTEVQKRRQRGYGQDRRWHEVKKWSVSTSEINKIDIGGNRFQGALGGIFYGFIAGASLGLIGGLSQSDDHSGFFNPGPAESAAMVGVLGAIVGLPIGFLVGGTDEYILQDFANDLEHND